MKTFLTLAAAALVFLAFPPAQAQQTATGANSSIPEMPAPIQDLVDQGAQVRFLGKDNGLDAWITIKNGQEQYFYVLPDKSGFLMGLLFDNKGKLITMQQVKRLQQQGDELLDTLATDAASDQPGKTGEEFKSPSERLYYEVEKSNWLPFGQAGAPIAYAFIDPKCPHCHAFIEDLRKGQYLDKGRIQLRMIPVGFKDDTRSMAAFLLAAPNPQERWYAHMDGDDTALPAKAEINQQGVERNLAIMQSWQFSVTPMIVYRATDNSIKLIRGRPKDLEAFLKDIGART